MFKSVQCVPLCNMSTRAARLHWRPAVRHSTGAAPGRSETAAWLQSLFTWLHKVGRGCGQTVPGRTKRKGLLSILADQCSFVTGQRLRRALQVAELYSNLYSERSRWTLVRSIWHRLQNKQAPTTKLLAALAGVFMWEDEKIRDDEMKRCVWELQALDVVKEQATEAGKRSAQAEAGWEIVMEKKSFRVWRRPVEGSHLFEYRVFGSYTDISPRQFFNVQLDTEYRKKWDALVIKLEVLDRDLNTGSEVIHWATHFPYPMYSRDYVYVRRYEVDVENNLMVLVSRAVEHPGVPETQEFVRVHSYRSRMVIRPHKSFDENGFDYMLTYSDDPQTVFPRYCVSWMVSSGMPDFLEKLHMAAVRAKNHEVAVHDYVGVMKQVQQASPERLEEGTRAAGSSHIYA